MARVCFDEALWVQPEYRSLPSPLRAALPALLSTIAARGDGLLSDELLRSVTGLGRKRMAALCEAMIQADPPWLLRMENGCLGLSEWTHGRVSMNAGADSAGVSHRSPEAERKHEERLAERVASLVMTRLGLGAEQEGGQSSSKVRTNGAQKADKSPSDPGHRDVKNRTNEGGNGPLMSGIGSVLSEIAGDSRAGAELNSNLIKLNSISSSEENLNSNSIQLNLIGEGQTQNPESPAPDPKTRIRSALLFYGLKPEETDKAFEVKSLEEIAQGLECLDLGYWKAATKKQYSDVVTLRNYLFSGLDLHSKFKAVLKERQTGSLALLFRVEGGKARERPTCSLALPEKLTPEQEEALAAQAKRDVANIRANLGLRHATV